MDDTIDLQWTAPGMPATVWEASGIRPHLLWRVPTFARRTPEERAAEVWLLERGVIACAVALLMASGWVAAT